MYLYNHYIPMFLKPTTETSPTSKSRLVALLALLLSGVLCNTPPLGDRRMRDTVDTYV